jgi:hypothetical protein
MNGRLCLVRRSRATRAIICGAAPGRPYRGYIAVSAGHAADMLRQCGLAGQSPDMPGAVLACQR